MTGCINGFKEFHMIIINGIEYKNFEIKTYNGNYSIKKDGVERKGIAPTIRFICEDISIDIEMIYDILLIEKLGINETVDVTQYVSDIMYQDEEGWISLINGDFTCSLIKKEKSVIHLQFHYEGDYTIIIDEDVPIRRVISKKDFTIEYDDSNDYIIDVVQYLEENMKRLMDFFELDSLSSKKRIIIYNHLEDYQKHIDKFIKYQDYMRADTMDGNINLLSIEEAHKTKEHKDMTLEDLKSTILHEAVHICQQESQLEKNHKEIIWFWEALATNLGNPDKFRRIKIQATNEEIEHFETLSNSYPIAFTIGNYLFEHYSNKELLEYVKYPSKLLLDSDKILDSAREWSRIYE